MKMNICSLLLFVVILIIHVEGQIKFPVWLERRYDHFRRGLTRAVLIFGSAPNRDYYRRKQQSIPLDRSPELINRTKSSFQNIVPENVPFPCPTGPGSLGARSATRPTSVHRLRPGDIDVIGAIGDSLSAGTGAASFNVVEMVVENRGMAWSGGGESTWRKYLTLPNILKEFNPNLIGYSLSDSLGSQKNSQFNVAEPLAISEDTLFQAKLFERRLRADSRVDFENDWKLVTIMIGSNDFCSSMCYYKNYTEVLDRHRVDIAKTLDYLMEKIPRILVNLVPPPDLRMIQDFKGLPPNCLPTQHLECPCLFAFRWAHLKDYFMRLMIQFQEVEIEIVNSDRYSSKEDFAVVIQPFLSGARIPERKTKDGVIVTDMSYLSNDCFHLSQKTHAIIANGVWNNMLQPVGNKTKGMAKVPFYQFLCPTEEHPFIFTSKNSEM